MQQKSLSCGPVDAVLTHSSISTAHERVYNNFLKLKIIVYFIFIHPLSLL